MQPKKGLIKQQSEFVTRKGSKAPCHSGPLTVVQTWTSLKNKQNYLDEWTSTVTLRIGSQMNVPHWIAELFMGASCNCPSTFPKKYDNNVSIRIGN